MKFLLFLILTVYNLSLFPQRYSSSAEIINHRYNNAVWVATVFNIDFPSSNRISSAKLKEEIIDLFENLSKLNINTVYFQIRSECDAFYPSNIEPISYWLTGEQGKSFEINFDPLEFAISEAKKRNIEFHAWLNPYRAAAAHGTYTYHKNHVINSKPELILEFGKMRLLDPGNPASVQHILSVIDDVVSRYNVDGIHYDDYFYPYDPQIKNEDLHTFKKYGSGFNNIKDWRRENVHNLIRKTHALIKSIKPGVQFGVSPFGIVSNRAKGTAGLSSYDEIYCDPVVWIQEGIVDYIVPQIYFEIGHKRADFKIVYDWWAKNHGNVKLIAGLYGSKFYDQSTLNGKNELIEQAKLILESKSYSGLAFFSYKILKENSDKLREYLNSSLSKIIDCSKLEIPEKPGKISVINEDGKSYLVWEYNSYSNSISSKFRIFRSKIDDLNGISPVLLGETTLNRWEIKLDNTSGGEFEYSVFSVNQCDEQSELSSNIKLRLKAKQ